MILFLAFWLCAPPVCAGNAELRAVMGPAPAVALEHTALDPAARPADAWLGEDKARHFLMSFAVTTLGYGVGRTVGLDAEQARLAGAAGSAVAGLGKEVYDDRAGTFFSVRDLVWDALGIALGMALVHNIR